MKNVYFLLFAAVLFIFSNCGSDQTRGQYKNWKDSFNKGEYQESLSILENNLTYIKGEFGEKHYLTAKTYHNMAKVYMKLKNYDKAKEYHYKGLNINRNIYGEDHIRTSVSYILLGKLYFDIIQYKRAVEYTQKAIPSLEKDFGKNELSLARVYNFLGLSYFKLKNYKSAIVYFQKGLVINEKILDNGNKEKGLNHFFLATVLFLDKQADLALGHCQKGLNIFLKAHGKIYLHTAQSYELFGVIYTYKRNKSKAIENFKIALSIYEELGNEAAMKRVKNFLIRLSL